MQLKKSTSIMQLPAHTCSRVSWLYVWKYIDSKSCLIFKNIYHMAIIFVIRPLHVFVLLLLLLQLSYIDVKDVRAKIF